MRQVAGILFLMLLIFGAVVFWQKEKVLAHFRPQKILSPFFRQPDVYDLLSMLEKNGVKSVSAPIISGETIQATISGVTVYFSKDKDFFGQVRSLQLVLPRIKMEDRPVKEIDLRYTKVVIRF